MKYYLEKILSDQNLDRQETRQVLESILTGEITPIQAGAFLTALRFKGEDIEEILGFVDTMEAHMIRVDLEDEDAIDMCGTGGDNSTTFNVSTTAALVVAAGGVTIAKHGNRAISSHCGSADLLEALGVKINLNPLEVKKCINQTGFGFFFAPLFHPAMKTLAPVRKSLEIRTIFNILGPLLNPARVRRQLIGTFNLVTAKKVAKVLQARKYKKACTVHSNEGFDEISPFSETQVFEIGQHTNTVKEILYMPTLLYPKSSLNEIQGKSCQENVEITQNILKGSKGIAREMTVLNAAFGFYVAEKVKTVEEGIQFSQELLDSGAVKKKLEDFIEISND
jgi:anthranilate phosphoribosyltransferase